MLKMLGAGPHAKRLDRDGETVGMLLLLANGRWGIYDRHEREKLSKISYATPRQAFSAAKPLGEHP